MTSGYTLIDCRGLDLTSQAQQTLAGIYTQLRTAMIIGKPIIGCNCIWGEGKPLTPVHLFAYQSNENTVVCATSTLNISVTSSDVVTIQNLVS